MTISPKYRLLLAVFLTALYAFIATPVQVWHHHTVYKHSGKISGESSSFSFVSKNISAADEVDCPVCTHHYSVFAEDSVMPELSAPFLFTKAYAGSYLPRITSFYFSISNKGPPVLA